MDMDGSGGGGGIAWEDDEQLNRGGNHQEGGREDSQADLRGQGHEGGDGAMEMGQLEKDVETGKVPNTAKRCSMMKFDPPNSSDEICTNPRDLLESAALKEEVEVGQAEGSSAAFAPVNPLLIEEIMEAIFKLILAQPGPSDVAQDVRSIRLVSKKFRDAVTPLFRRNRSPTVIDLRGAVANHPIVEDFLETMKSSAVIPAQSYTIHCNFNDVSHRELVKKFLRICGSEAVSLAFFPVFHTVEAVEPDGFSGLNLSKLKTLYFELPNSRSSSSSQFVNLIQIVLNAAKELKGFEMRSGDSKADVEMQQLANAVLTGLPTTVKILKLREFPPVNEQTFQKWTESGIQLEEFEFLKEDMLDKESFCKFLQSQSRTLKTLKIFNEGKEESSSVSLDIPRMEKLLNLEFKYIIPERLSFAETFPKVSTLKLEDWKREEVFLELLGSVEKTKVAPAVKKLFMPAIPVKVFMKKRWALPVKRMSDCFPNISELYIESNEATNGSMHEIFAYFTNVEQLEIQFSYTYAESADALLSGVPDSRCNRIRRRKNFDDVELHEIQERSSILCMTKLKKLVLKEKFWHHTMVDLSDFSVHFLFLRMTGLEELAIYDSDLISPQYEELLGRHVKFSVSTVDEVGRTKFILIENSELEPDDDFENMVYEW